MILGADNLEFQAILPVKPLPTSFPAPAFALGLCCDETLPAVTCLVFLPSQAEIAPKGRFARTVIQALEEWLHNPCYVFDLPTILQGTQFQRRVWAEIAAIPCGETTSYAQIAENLGSAPRAVGGACGANPVPIIIPCHRVIGKNGGLTGFSHTRTGWMPEIKRWLLAREGINIREARRV
ncbi:MAG: methylated-DNA--[protein]-cysteine S-methyltransferase [Betaproteobacteria bacterium]|nr:methylated-DNA--[protein]-cysteine S-methyltransferase [Betaproteobacteria bacterium]